MPVVCPKCGFNNENETDCLKCGINFKEFARLKEQQHARENETAVFPPLENSGVSGLDGGAADAALAEAFPQGERWDRLSFDNSNVRLLAFPAAIIAAFILDSPQQGGPLDNLRVWIHEFGHAIVGWFGGHRAIPLGPPFGWTTIEPERSVVVYVAILFLLSVLFYTALKEKLYSAMAVAAAFMLLQTKLTWATSPITLDELIKFGGVAGELYIGTLLMIAFYVRMPDRWRWDLWRFFVLVIAAVTFFHEYRFWHDVRWGRERIPWGSGLFGPDDENGDMNRLSWQFGWSDSRIITTYYSLANAGLLAIITAYVWSLISLRVRQRSIFADEVLPGDGQTHDWVVRSCMPKPDWQQFLTIRYRDNFYQMFKQNIGPKPRPFVYYLRKPPSGHLINAIRDYKHEDVLKKS